MIGWKPGSLARPLISTVAASPSRPQWANAFC